MKLTNVDEWLKAGKYLPEFMRDFHAQKDIFKAVHELLRENDGTKRISWVDAHIYTIDVFLWFMARRGYTLQRTRTKGEFRDLDADVAEAKKRRDDAFTAAFMQGMKSSNE